MALIFISPKAVEDLDGIKDYIENRLKNPIAAKRTVLRIIDAYGVLADYPELGSLLQTSNKSLNQYRHLIADNYIVFYRIENGNVYIVRILHRLMNYLKILL